MSGHIETGDEKGMRMAREALNKARNGEQGAAASKGSTPRTFFCAVCSKPIGKGSMAKNEIGRWVCLEHAPLSIDRPGKSQKAKPEARPVRVSPEYTATEEYNTIDHPKHYTDVVPEIECIQVTEHFDFLLGNAIKYIWRSGRKYGNTKLQDLKKAEWYIKRAIAQESK